MVFRIMKSKLKKIELLKMRIYHPEINIFFSFMPFPETRRDV